MVGEEFATALRIEPSRRRAGGRFPCEIQRYRLDDGISNQKLLYDLNLRGIRFPVFLDRPREELRTDHHDRGARGCACFPCSLDAGRGEIDRARITPALDHVDADLASNHVASGQINTEREIAKQDPGIERRFVDNLQKKWVPPSRLPGWNTQQLGELGGRWRGAIHDFDRHNTPVSALAPCERSLRVYHDRDMACKITAEKARAQLRKNGQNNSRRGEDTPAAQSDTDLQSRRWSGMPPVNRELEMHKKAFTPDNAAMLLIDHQLGTISWTRSRDINLVRQNAIRSSPSSRSIGPLPMVQS
jgi:hypothetical protein